MGTVDGSSAILIFNNGNPFTLLLFLHQVSTATFIALHLDPLIVRVGLEHLSV